MTGHDLTTAREQLAQAVAQFDPPPFYPINATPLGRDGVAAKGNPARS